MIDMGYLEQVAKGNIAFMLEMINIFLVRTPETLLELEQVILGRNWEMVGFLAHKLKATYAYMGMLDLKEYLIIIERNAKTGTELEMILPLFLKIREQTTEAIREIDQYRLSIQGNNV